MAVADIGTLRARVAIETDQFVRGIAESRTRSAEFRRELQQVGRELREVDREMDETGDETGELADRKRELTQRANSLNAQIERERIVVRRAQQSLSGYERQTRDTASAKDRLTGALRSARAAFGALAAAGGVAAVASVVGRLADRARETAQRMGELRDQAARIGEDPTRLQQFQSLLRQFGVNSETAAVGLNELGIRISDFTELGAGTFADVVQVLGQVNVEGRALIDVAADIADRTRELSAAQRAFVLDAAFGGEFAEQLNLALDQMTDGLDAGIRGMAALGGLTREQIEEQAGLRRELERSRIELENRWDRALAENQGNIENWLTALNDMKIGLLDFGGAVTETVNRPLFRALFSPGGILGTVTELTEAAADAATDLGAEWYKAATEAVGPAQEFTLSVQQAAEQLLGLSSQRMRLDQLGSLFQDGDEAVRQFVRTLVDGEEELARLQDRLDELTGAERASRLQATFERLGLSADTLGREIVTLGERSNELLDAWVREPAATMFEAVEADAGDAADEIGRAQDAAERFTASLADGLAAAVVDGRRLSDVLGDIARQIARAAVQSFFGRIFGSLGFSLPGSGAAAQATFAPSVTVNVQGTPDVAALTASIRNEVVPVVQASLSQAAEDAGFRRALALGA